MKILGVDSSGMTASAALVQDGVLAGEYTINHKKTHSQTLLPMISEMMKMVETDIHSVDAIAVAAGPGSFTGLRIGAATVKGLGLAIDKPVVPVPTLEGLAFNMWGSEDFVCPIMDARRNQVYTGLYVLKDAPETVIAQKASDIHDLISEINDYGKPVTFLGDGVPVFKEIILKELSVPCRFAPAHLNLQRAASVALLGEIYYNQGKAISADEFAPFYLRKSQAEREREEMQREGKL